jgi:hypothetical protein
MFCPALAFLTVPVAYITNKIINRFYPGTIKTYCAYYGWYFLEFCSRVEIKVQNAYTIIRPYFPSCKKDETATITLIRDGEEIQKYTFNEFISLRDTENIQEGTYDLILYELPIQDNHKYDKYILRYKHHKDIMKIEYNAINEYNFNSIQFKFNGTETIYNINFNKNQFMINGNILFDRDFMKWFMLKYNNAIVQDVDKYSISFIDHNMNYNIITESDHILVKNKTYEIVSTKVEAQEQPVITSLEPTSFEPTSLEPTSLEPTSLEPTSLEKKEQ